MRKLVCVCVYKCQRNFSKDDVQLPLVSGDKLLFTPLVLGVQCSLKPSGFKLTLLGKPLAEDERRP